MKKLKPIIDSLRLSMTILAALLVHAGFAISHQPTNWWLVIVVFWITGMTMLQNDYFDRAHDLKKGKNFVFNNHVAVRNTLGIVWSVLILISIVFLFQSFGQGLILLFCIFVGIFYSFSRKVLLLPALLVSITSSSPTLFAFVSTKSPDCILLFLSVFLVILGREIIKDVEDESIDAGYKKTILTEKIMTAKAALKISASIIFLGSLLSLSLYTNQQQSVTYFLYLGGFCLCIGASVILFCTDDWKGGRNTLDMGVAIIILSLSIPPFHL